MERKKEAKLFFVTGRIPGDDDDTTEVIAATDEDAACAAFKSELYERRCGKPLPLSGSEDAVFVTGSGEIGAVLPNGLVRLTGAVIDACPEGTPKAAAPIDWEVVGAPMKAHGISGDIAPDETESQFLARMIDDLAIVAAMPRAVNQLIEQCGGDMWGRCGDYPRSDWENEVANGDTILGYWGWIIQQAEGDDVSLESLHA